MLIPSRAQTGLDLCRLGRSWAGAANLVRVAQIGKLFSAMATVKQKLLKHKLETLADTQAPPPPTAACL